MSSESYDSCEAGVSVTSRPPVRVLRPRTEANQAKKRPREPETDALPAVEPPEKRSRWHLPGFLHGIFSQKQNEEALAEPSKRSEVAVKQKRGPGRQRKAAISKGKLQALPKRRSNRLNPIPSPATSELYLTSRTCMSSQMSCPICRISPESHQPGSPDKEESPDKLQYE